MNDDGRYDILGRKGEVEDKIEKGCSKNNFGENDNNVASLRKQTDV